MGGFGGWHFISLNASSQFNQVAVGKPKYNWLTQDPAANACACTIVYFHQPVFSIGPEGSTTSSSTGISLASRESGANSPG